MSEIKIERNHKLGRAEAHKRVVEIESHLKDKYGVRLDWSGDRAEVKGTGVSGTLDVDDARVNVNLKLGLLLKPMAGKIKGAIESQIEKALA